MFDIFSLINTESSRRDDLESLAYVLIYFLRGSLPWRKLKGKSVRTTWDMIRDKKVETASFLSVGLPEEFEIFYQYVRGLDFGDDPDYEGVRQMFRGLAQKQGIEYDGEFDWIRPRHFDEVRVEEEGKRVRRCRACEACKKARAEEGRA